MATTIVTKNSSTASAVPTAGQLVQGELAVNVADKKLYTEDNAGSIIVLADGVKLAGIEALADVTDTANVTAAGALMDSELTNITAVKALNQGVATTDSPSFVGLTASGEITANGGIALGDNDKATFGNSDDLQIYHDGATSIIADTGTGYLALRGDGNVTLQNAAGTENKLVASSDGAVTIYYDNAAKLATTATGIDVTGSVVADGLTVDGTANFNSNNVVHTATTPNYVLSESDVVDENTQFLQASGTLRIRTVTDAGALVAERLRIDHATGDISFYEDTGTSPKFVWDSSAESLGIGTSSPDANLHVFKGESGGAAPNSQASLVLENSSNTYIQFLTPASNESGLLFGDADNDRGALTYNHASDFMAFSVAAATRMRIDSAGNLLVGQTTASSNTVGTSLRSDGRNFYCADGNYSGHFNRKTSDGAIVHFAKDDTVVGTVGVKGTDLTIGNTVTGLQFYDFGNALAPVNVTTNANTDGATNLGLAGSRFKDLYLSGKVASASNNFYELNDGSFGTIIQAAGGIKFNTAGVNERMRIDSSGNLLVGTSQANPTSSGVNVAGQEFSTTGGVRSTVASNAAATFNRKTDDGEIVLFRKDGTTVGSIGTAGGDITIGTGDTGLTFEDSADVIHPINQSTGAARDNAIDLGKSAARFKDLYLSGGVYQSGTRLIKRTATSSGGSTIFASITDAPQTGFIHIYEIGTTNYAILACTKRDTSSDVVTTVVANNVLTVNATNAGGTVAVTGHTTTGNVRMQATIIREA